MTSNNININAGVKEVESLKDNSLDLRSYQEEKENLKSLKELSFPLIILRVMHSGAAHKNGQNNYWNTLFVFLWPGAKMVSANENCCINELIFTERIDAH